MNKVGGVLVLLLIMTLGVLAHDMWLESSSFFASPGEEIVIRNGNGTIYRVSENGVAVDRIGHLLGLSPEGKRLVLGTPYVEKNWLQLKFRPPKEGNYWIGLSTKPRLIRLSGKDFNSYLEHDGLPAVLEERTKKGILARDEVEQYSKYVKLYLQVGDKRSDNYNQPLGLPIEMVLEQNPYELRTGQGLPLRVLFHDKPLAGFLLHAGSAGQAAEGAPQYTDNQGRATIQIDRPGKWYIRGIHLVRVDQAEFSYQSHWATVTFEVRK
ncbi:MAG: DUF4198 domain-containing protein [Acidobacteriota bacterium]